VTLTVTDPAGTGGSPALIPLRLQVVERLFPLHLPLIFGKSEQLQLREPERMAEGKQTS
jgi:hypothetical protein